MREDVMTFGVDLIAAERKRQIEVEGYTPEHDKFHLGYDLCAAATCYLEFYDWDPTTKSLRPSMLWPWTQGSWKPSKAEDPKERAIRNLTKAGALIAAEIDRLQNAPSTT